MGGCWWANLFTRHGEAADTATNIFPARPCPCHHFEGMSMSTRISDCAPLGMHCISVDVQGKFDDKSSIVQKWTHWDLNPGPSACEADVIPLHHVPSGVKLQQIVHQSPGRADRLDWHPARILLLARFIGPAYCLGLLARFIALRWQTQSPWSA